MLSWYEFIYISNENIAVSFMGMKTLLASDWHRMRTMCRTESVSFADNCVCSACCSTHMRRMTLRKIQHTDVHHALQPFMYEHLRGSSINYIVIIRKFCCHNDGHKICQLSGTAESVEQEWLKPYLSLHRDLKLDGINRPTILLASIDCSPVSLIRDHMSKMIINGRLPNT